MLLTVHLFCERTASRAMYVTAAAAIWVYVSLMDNG